MQKLWNNALVVVLGLTLGAAAQQAPRVYREGNAWVEESSGTLPSARVLRVNTEQGTVRVQGGSSTLTYTVKKKSFAGSEAAARRQLESFRVTGARAGDAAVLRAEFTDSTPRKFAAEFTLQVPRELDLVRVETRGGSINVAGIAGRVEAETAGGGMRLDDIGGAIQANTMGGDITVNNAAGEAVLKSAGGGITVESVGGRLNATTYGGDMQVGTVKLAAYLETAGGSIRVRQTGGDLRASTAGGNIEAGDVGGAATLKTAGGSIRLNSARGPVEAATAGGGIRLGRLEKGVRAETAAGGITVEFAGVRGGFTESYLATTAGDITVYIPSNLACSIRAAIEMASGHKIRSDFPEVKIVTEGGDYGPKEWYAQGALNGGGPVLKLRTSIGDIEIRRAAQH